MPIFSCQSIGISICLNIGSFSRYWYRYCIILFLTVYSPTLYPCATLVISLCHPLYTPSCQSFYTTKPTYICYPMLLFLYSSVSPSLYPLLSSLYPLCHPLCTPLNHTLYTPLSPSLYPLCYPLCTLCHPLCSPLCHPLYILCYPFCTLCVTLFVPLCVILFIPSMLPSLYPSVSSSS